MTVVVIGSLRVKIKRQTLQVFPGDVERTGDRCCCVAGLWNYMYQILLLSLDENINFFVGTH